MLSVPPLMLAAVTNVFLKSIVAPSPTPAIVPLKLVGLSIFRMPPEPTKMTLALVATSTVLPLGIGTGALLVPDTVTAI
jgi:hypothetical protein